MSDFTLLAEALRYRASPVGQAWAEYWRTTASYEKVWWKAKEEARIKFDLAIKQADQTYQEAILPMEIVLEEKLRFIREGFNK